MISFVKPSAPSRTSITLLTSAWGTGPAVSQIRHTSAEGCETHRRLEIEECACVQGEEAHLARRRRPVDEDEREALAAVPMVELVREHDVARGVLRELCAAGAAQRRTARQRGRGVGRERAI